MKNFVKEFIIDKFPHFSYVVHRRKTYKKDNPVFKNNLKNAEKIIKESNAENPKIAFIINFSAAWTSLKSVHDEAQKMGLETAIICPPKAERDGTDDVYDELKNEYSDIYKVDGNGKGFDLEAFAPNYVFYTRPYNDTYPKCLQSKNVSRFAKTCLIEYGYDISNDKKMKDVTFNCDFANFLSMFFASTKREIDYAKNFYGKDVLKTRFIYDVGFPRFDLIKRRENDTNKKTVLWTPRWTLDSKNRSTSRSSFLVYDKEPFNWAKKNPNTDLIFRPHPRLFDNYIDSKKITEQEYLQLLKEMEETPNVTYDKSGDYFESINKTDIFVSDYTGLLIEFALTGKPVIYFGNLKAIDDKKLREYFYYTTSWEQTEKYIDDINNGIDPKKEYRSNFVKEFLKGKENAGKRIVETIISDYNKTKGK